MQNYYTQKNACHTSYLQKFHCNFCCKRDWLKSFSKVAIKIFTIAKVSWQKLDCVLTMHYTCIMQVNISDTRTLRETCGLCGTTEGFLLHRNGNTANIMNRTEVDAFAKSYLVAPRDQFLHPQRRECGEWVYVQNNTAEVTSLLFWSHDWSYK